MYHEKKVMPAKKSAIDPILTQLYKSPYGTLILGAYDNKICLCDWVERRTRTRIDQRIQGILNAAYIEQASETTDMAITQLEAYFTQQFHTFNLPLLMLGTPFQQTVWQCLANIPYGSTISYLQLAKKINKPSAARAVANANNANAISIIIPCHRVIGSDGNLRGYAGGLEAKQHLLNLEASTKNQTDNT